MYLNRHAIVPTISNRAPGNDEGKDEDLWVDHPGLRDEEVRKHREKQRREHRIALIGFGIVLAGFALQIVGWVASNLQ